ncbi:MAG: hypothetical protein JST48_11680 [Bacteroidetes bacterium]|nr:hypothetical protein [Bacteroidota bacterium]
MRKLYFLCVVAFLTLSMTPDLWAQFNKKGFNRRSIKKNNKRISTFTGKKHFGREHVYSGVGFSVNALNYYGDLSPLPSKFSTDISFTKPAFGISFFHRFGPRYTLVGQFMYGTLKGSDAESAKGGDGNWRKERNLSFRNRIKELSLTAYFDLFENEGTYINRVRWTPYVFAGFAAFLQNPQAQAPTKYLDGSPDPYAGKWVDLQPLGTEGQYSNLPASAVNSGIKPYGLMQVAIPFGFGARFRLNEVLDLWADVGFRYTFTDYLDDVSKNFVDLNSIKAKDPSMTQLAQAMAYRSNELLTPAVSNTINTYALNTPNGVVNIPVVNGYGTEYKTNNRGARGNSDIYMVTSIRISYILGATFHRAKFR